MEFRKARPPKKFNDKRSNNNNSHNTNYLKDRKKSYRNSKDDRKPRYDRESRSNRKENFKKSNSFKQDRKQRKMKEFYSGGSEKFYNTLKEKLFEILGGKKCSSCGFRDERALGFTHIYDKTAFDEIRRGGFAASWGKYIAHPELARKDILVLCLNCNAIREPEIKKDHQKNTKSRSKFFPRKENMNATYEN